MNMIELRPLKVYRLTLSYISQQTCMFWQLCKRICYGPSLELSFQGALTYKVILSIPDILGFIVTDMQADLSLYLHIL